MNIDYNTLVQKAMLGTVLDALSVVADDMTMSKYEIYLTINTTDARVELPDHLRAEYPTAITVVLNHQFDNLIVDMENKTVEVTVYFGQQPVHIKTPVDSILSFSDMVDKFQVTFVDEDELMPVDPTPSEAQDNNIVSLDDYR